MTAPIRMCRVCRQHAPKGQLHRWVVQDRRLAADPAGTKPGRGYYTCDQARCQEILPKMLKVAPPTA